MLKKVEQIKELYDSLDGVLNMYVDIDNVLKVHVSEIETLEKLKLPIKIRKREDSEWDQVAEIENDNVVIFCLISSND